MIKRRLLLLKLMHGLGQKGIRSRTAILKSVFLMKKEYPVESRIPLYSFYPYKFGPFSEKCYADMRELEKAGLICPDEATLTEKGRAAISGRDLGVEDSLKCLLGRFDTTKGIMDYVYSKYPEFTVKSELLKESDKSAHNEEGCAGIYTIGYEGKDIDKFLNILIQNDICVLVDVRNNPFSMNLAYTKKKLREYLGKVGIQYMHVPELGVESGHRKNLVTDSDYAALFDFYRNEVLPRQTEKMAEIAELGKSKKVALMCFEADKGHCHRGPLSEMIGGMMGWEVVHL